MDTGSDQLASLSVGGTVVQTIGYTADGRIASLNPGIQAPTGQYITSLSYNQDGRLTSVNAGGGALASYIYDGFEQRLIKTVSGSWGEIYQYGQDGGLLEETNASGVAQADYIYLNGRPVAVLNGSTLYYLHDDILGTPQLATDSNQAVAWQSSYDAFGQASVSGTVTQNLRLPGQYFDVESGWNHNGFRDYAPQLGRYIEPDPLGRLGSGNTLYVYVNDNPTRFVDKLGLCSTPCSSLSLDDPNTFWNDNFATPAQIDSFMQSTNTPSNWDGYNAAQAFIDKGINPGLAVGIMGAETSMGNADLGPRNIQDPFSSGGIDFDSSLSRGLGVVTKLEDTTSNDSAPLTALIDQNNTLNEAYEGDDMATRQAWVNHVNSWYRKLAKALGLCK